MTANLADLDLTDSKISSGRIMLKVGRHQTRVREARVEPCKNGMMLIVEHDAKDGSGSITDRIIYHHSNPDAERIGKERMKSLLTHGGYPNPNKPSGVNAFRGLGVTTVVVPDDKEFTDKTGATRKGTVRVGGYSPPESGMFADPNETHGSGAEDPPF